MLEQAKLLTADGVDITSLVGKRVWYQPYGDGSLDSFVVNGIDITMDVDGKALSVRAYEDDYDKWILVSDLRSKAGMWGVEAYKEKMDKIVADAAKNGVVVTGSVVVDE